MRYGIRGWNFGAYLSVLVLTSFVWAESTLSEAPRAARSVHLGYPAPDGDLLYTEMVIRESVNGSYFMAAGWNTGYFGLQQLDSPDKKVVLFSVWDPTHGDDPAVVKPEDRVELLYESPGVRIRRFGGEGTGGQCMAPFSWKLGQKYGFALQGVVEGQKTAYTAWLERSPGDWWKLATFRTRTGGQPLKGYYSFVEDFRRDGLSPKEVRRASFGAGWIRSLKGDWISLRRARFTASGAEWESKDNIDAGLDQGMFFLGTGGSLKASHPLNTILQLPGPISLP